MCTPVPGPSNVEVATDRMLALANYTAVLQVQIRELRGKHQATCERLREQQCRLRRLQGERMSLQHHLHTLRAAAPDVPGNNVPLPGVPSSELSMAKEPSGADSSGNPMAAHACYNHGQLSGAHSRAFAVFEVMHVPSMVTTAVCTPQILLCLMPCSCMGLSVPTMDTVSMHTPQFLLCAMS